MPRVIPLPQADTYMSRRRHGRSREETANDPAGTPTGQRTVRPARHAGRRAARSRRRARDQRRPASARPTPPMRWCRPCWCRTRRSSAPTPASRNSKASSAGEPQTARGGGFLDTMRDAHVRPRRAARLGAVGPAGGPAGGMGCSGMGSSGAWNTRTAPRQRLTARPDAARRWRSRPGAMVGGGSFLGTAAAGAAGVVGGALLLNGIRSHVGRPRTAARVAARSIRAGGGGRTPWGGDPPAAISPATPASTTSARRPQRARDDGGSAPACSTAATTTSRRRRRRRRIRWRIRRRRLRHGVMRPTSHDIAAMRHVPSAVALGTFLFVEHDGARAAELSGGTFPATACCPQMNLAHSNGGRHGTRVAAVVDRDSVADHFVDLGIRRVELRRPSARPECGGRFCAPCSAST